MAKIIFLGSGGGRIVVINQLRATGGFILEMCGEKLHVDPGPGALVRAKQYGVKLTDITGILVSHAHPDHYTDLEMVIEAMNLGAKKKRGILISNEHVIKGGDEYHSIVSSYHLNVLEKYKILKPGDVTRIGDVEITATDTKHGEEKAIGFVFKCKKENLSVGYTSDGEFFPEQPKYFKGCDYLIINCLRPRNAEWPEHMNAGDAKKLIGEVKPKLAIIKHFGIKMLRGVAEKEASWIQKETGIKTIAAKDGMVLELNDKKSKVGKGLEKFFENK